MKNTTKLKLRVMKLFTALLMTMSMSPFLFQGNTSYALESNSLGSTSTESGTSGGTDEGDLNDFGVSMGQDGTISVEGLGDGDSTSTWTTFFKKYKIVILGISGIATLTFVVLFIKNFVSLGAASDNPQLRRAASVGCLWTGIAAALCGSVTVIMGLFWNALKG